MLSKKDLLRNHRAALLGTANDLDEVLSTIRNRQVELRLRAAVLTKEIHAMTGDNE